MKKLLIACLFAFTVSAITATAKPNGEAAEIHYKVPKPEIKAVMQMQPSPIVFVYSKMTVIDLPEFTKTESGIDVPFYAFTSIGAAETLFYSEYWQGYDRQDHLYSSFILLPKLSPSISISRCPILRC